MSEPDPDVARRRADARRLRRVADAESEEGRELADAVAFLRVGGTISWDRWRSLGPASKKVLGLAAGIVEHERLRVIAEMIGKTPPVDERQAKVAAARHALDIATGRKL